MAGATAGDGRAAGGDPAARARQGGHGGLGGRSGVGQGVAAARHRRRIVQGGIEIKAGLKPGDWVVSAGANSLADGEIVRLPKAPEAAKAPAGGAS